MSHELAILGAGNMAEAIARGVLSRGTPRADQIVAADVSPRRRELFQNELNIRAIENAADAAAGAKIVLLSVKPQQMADVLGALKGVLTTDTLLVSIAAGISTGFIEKAVNSNKPWRVIRTMPNTPMLVGQGMVAMARGRYATDADLASARNLFDAAATVIEVPEGQIDAVTAVSGSGPAYFFFLVEQMVRAGVELGLSPENAHTLAAHTALGAATMLTRSSDVPAELRRKVTSPGGTTHEAITSLERNHWPTITVEAIKAAARRSKELGL